jgi:hypothetical protein
MEKEEIEDLVRDLRLNLSEKDRYSKEDASIGVGRGITYMLLLATLVLMVCPKAGIIFFVLIAAFVIINYWASKEISEDKKQKHS